MLTQDRVGELADDLLDAILSGDRQAAEYYRQLLERARDAVSVPAKDD